MGFRGWLRLQVSRDDMIGDLARDSFADSGWRGRTASSLKLRLDASGLACDGAYEALDLAINDFLWFKISPRIRKVSNSDG